MAKILVSDKLSDAGLKILKDAPGLEVDTKSGLKPDELKAIIGQYDGLVIRSGTKVTADLVSAADKLKIIGRAGIGVDNVDTVAASKKGIIVENTPHWDNGQLEQIDNGETGWVVRSVGGLAAAINDLTLHVDRRIAYGKAGRQKVLNCFDRSRGVFQYELAYQQLVGAKSSSEVLAEIYPSAFSLVAYHKQYKALSQLDFPHQASVLLELKRKAFYWYWRALDSLVARGLKKL